MKTFLTAFGFLIFAVLMLPGVIKPPTDAVTAGKVQVAALSHALGAALIEYHAAYGEFPEGDRAEILKRLQGKNKKDKVFFESPRESMNDAGELLDPWGTPFRISFDDVAKRPLVESAGPNRVFEPASGMHQLFSDDYRSRH